MEDDEPLWCRFCGLLTTNGLAICQACWDAQRQYHIDRLKSHRDGAEPPELPHLTPDDTEIPF